MSTHSLNLPTPIAIVGLGISGLAALDLLQVLGVPTESLITFDQKGAGAQVNNPADLIKKAPKTLVVSPGVSIHQDWIQNLKDQGVLITSEIGIASQYLTTEKVIGITGSVGKSTTTSLIGAGARALHPGTFVGGNLGVPLSRYIVELRKKMRHRAKFIVLELSSYQLENCDPLKLNTSVITHFGPNHLDRYSDFLEYYNVKWSLVGRTKGNVYLNSNGGELKNYASEHVPRAKLRSARLKWVSPEDEQLKNFPWDSSQLLGDHNKENLALAARIAVDLNWGGPAIKEILNFPGLPHRLENLGIASNGVHIINDSKATTIDSVLASCKSLVPHVPAESRLILLLGGRDKGLPWEGLIELQDIRQLRFFFFGECARIAQGKSRLPGKSFSNLKQALEHSKIYARKDDWVVLSPGGSSLDEFANFEARGDFFRNFFFT